MNGKMDIDVKMSDEVLRYIENNLSDIRREFQPMIVEIREKDAKIASMEQKIDLLTAALDALKANELLWQSSVMEKDRAHNHKVNRLECENEKLRVALSFWLQAYLSG